MRKKKRFRNICLYKTPDRGKTVFSHLNKTHGDLNEDRLVLETAGFAFLYWRISVNLQDCYLDRKIGWYPCDIFLITLGE